MRVLLRNRCIYSNSQLEIVNVRYLCQLKANIYSKLIPIKKEIYIIIRKLFLLFNFGLMIE